MGRILSGSTQRGIGVDTQLLTALAAPNPEAGVAEVWEGLIGGVPGSGDVVSLEIDGIDYQYSYGAGDTAPMMADGVCDAAMLGSFDQHFFTFGGVLDAGDVATLIIGANTYNYTVLALDTAGDVAIGLAAAAIADPAYTVTAVGGSIQVKAIARGVGLSVTCTWTVDPGLDATIARLRVVTGVVAQVGWNAVALGAAITVTNSVVGPVTVPPTSSVVHYGAGTATFAALTLDTAGQDAWGTTGGVATGSFRTPEATALVTVAGPGVTFRHVGYFGATLGWVPLTAATFYAAGSYAIIVPCGSAERVLVEATVFGALASMDCTIQG